MSHSGPSSLEPTPFSFHLKCIVKRDRHGTHSASELQVPSINLTEDMNADATFNVAFAVQRRKLYLTKLKRKCFMLCSLPFFKLIMKFESYLKVYISISYFYFCAFILQVFPNKVFPYMYYGPICYTSSMWYFLLVRRSFNDVLGQVQ